MSYLYSFRSFRHLLGVGLLAATCFRASAQTAPDTTRLSYGEEEVATPAADAPLRVQPENRSLWKLGLNDFTLSANRGANLRDFYTRYGVPLAYERRLGASAWSVLVEASPGLIRYRPATDALLKRGLELQTQVAGRYYYNLERRLRLGRNTTHFSANYVSVALANQFGPRQDYAVVQALYGLQRRLGRYGFLDFNFGPGSTVSDRRPRLYLASGFRIGLALSAWPSAPYQARSVPAYEESTLLPSAYVGVQFGAYTYRTSYPGSDAYRTSPTHVLGFPDQDKRGVGTYDLLYNRPYAYAGYYVAPRWAVQVGVQQSAVAFTRNTYDTQRDSVSGTGRERGVALPVLLRYSLTQPFLKRLQVDALGGLVPAWSRVRYREQRFNRGAATGESGFERSSFGMHATWGLNASYGLGRRRRVQATSEIMLTKALQNVSQSEESLQAGVSLGLRYRFAYR